MECETKTMLTWLKGVLRAFSLSSKERENKVMATTIKLSHAAFHPRGAQDDESVRTLCR